jgi:hypothetical protein
MTMNTSITSNSITDGQKKQIKRFAEDAVDRVFNDGVLDKDGAQKLIANGDELQARVISAIRELSVPNEFADEEVESIYGYLSGYKPNRDQAIEIIVANFEGQVSVLDKLINCGKRFNPDWIVRVNSLCPQWVEKFFASFDWHKIAPTYEKALQKALDLIKQTRNGKFYNYREGKIGPERLRIRAKTTKALETLGQQQEGNDILVIPCQFGLRHRGRSVRRALEVMPTMEFGNDPFTIACMILTHPERLQYYDDLWIDCAGAEYDCDEDGSFSGAPCFSFIDGRVRFDGFYADNANDHYGSSSGFLPHA